MEVNDIMNTAKDRLLKIIDEMPENQVKKNLRLRRIYKSKGSKKLI